jgi:hypothetical protein
MMRTLYGCVVFLVLCAGIAGSEDEAGRLKQRILEIQNAGELGFKRVTLCSGVAGYGRFDPLESDAVRSGERLFFYYEPVNLTTERRDGMYRVHYSHRLILKTAAGRELYNDKQGMSFDHVTRSPMLDHFVSSSIDLGNLPPGRYECILVLHDFLKKSEARHSARFEIAG